MNDFIIELDKEGVQANYFIKLKNEQNSLRKMVLRIDTIRDTEFIGSAYAIVEAMGFLTGLVESTPLIRNPIRNMVPATKLVKRAFNSMTSNPNL